MPCNCDHLEPTELEREVTRLHLLHDELDTGAHVDPRAYEGGADPRAYNKATKEEADRLTALLCKRLKSSSLLATRSLELQRWWRDHQEADRKREAREVADAKREELRRRAVAKLTEEERDALDI